MRFIIRAHAIIPQAPRRLDQNTTTCVLQGQMRAYFRLSGDM